MLQHKRSRQKRLVRQPMRVALFHLGFFYSGGGEKLVLEEMRALRATGIDVDCFAPYVDRKRCFPDMPEVAEVQSLLPPPPEWLPMKDPLWIALTCILIPLFALRFQAYDIFFGANQPGAWIAFVLSRLLRIPYVIYLAHPIRILHPREIDRISEIRIREGDHRFISLLTRTAGWFLDWADRISVDQASAVLTNGRHVGNWFRKVYNRESLDCPAGCHPIAQTALEYANRWSGDICVSGTKIQKPFVLLSNRHVPQKRFEYAIWAMKQIARDVPGLSLVITGQETEYTDQLKYLVGGLRLTDRVQFIGLVPEKELRVLYRQSVVYVYPSPEEDFGMGIIEAMAAGTPVVAWRNGGPTVTVVDEETGFLVEPYDVDEFSESMLALASNPSLSERMGRRGHRRAKGLFSYERHSQVLLQTLQAALDSSELPEAEVFPHIAATNSIIERSNIPIDNQDLDAVEVFEHVRSRE